MNQTYKLNNKEIDALKLTGKEAMLGIILVRVKVEVFFFFFFNGLRGLC